MLHRHGIKGQGLPISTIILIAIGLIVLVVLIVMVQQRSALFGTGLREASDQTCSPPNMWAPIGTDCDVIYGKFTDQKDHPNEICCRISQP